MTTTLTRPVPAMPGPKPGAHHDPRPCVTNPPYWWDTGNPNNTTAINLCNTRCPIRNRNACEPAKTERPYGVVRAGVAYNDHGTPLKQCPTCGRPMTESYSNSHPRCGTCTRNRDETDISIHHDAIGRLVSNKRSWSHIGAVLGVNPNAARIYWDTYVAKRRAEAANRKLVRLPGVTDETRSKPADHADLVIAMLTDRDNAYTAQEVAWVIGSTTDAVKSFWLRERKRRIADGEDMPLRRYVSNVVRNTRRGSRVAA